MLNKTKLAHLNEIVSIFGVLFITRNEFAAGGVNRFHLNGRNPFGTFQEVFTLNFSASLLEIAESKRHGFGSSGSM